MWILSDLVDKSVLTREPDGRYQIHELLRQYAQARLEATPDETIRIHDLHSAYYARFLVERDKDLNGGRQRDASFEIEADLDNIRSSWLWAVDHSRVEDIAKSEHPLVLFYQFQSRFLEGADAFEKAAHALDNAESRTEISLAKVLCSQGWMHIRLGAIEKAKAALERSWLLYSQHAVLPSPGRGSDPRTPLGLVYILMGNFVGAEKLGQDALEDHALRQDRFNLSFSCYLLANAARVQGKYEEAKQYAQQAYMYAVESADEFFAAYCLIESGSAARILGALGEARLCFQASYNIRKNFGDSEGMAVALNHLGRVAFLQGDNNEARQCYERALALYHDTGDKGGLATSLEGLGNSARESAHYQEAWRYLREALQVTRDQLVSRTLSIFIGIGELFFQTGQPARGIELLALALNHPVSDQDTQARAQQILNHYQAAEEAAQQTSRDVDSDAVITALLDELLFSEERTFLS
jgi:tetratricopeptide (TPR) repeat protein